MKMTEFFMRRPVLFWSLMAAILVAGVLAFVQMPKLEDPAVSAKQAMVVVAWPGAGAHEMELKVAQIMEDELRALPNVKKVKTECQNGSAMFTVEFQMTVLEKELEQHFDLLRRKVNDAASRLPQGCYSPVVVDDMMDVYGIFYALTADGYDYPEMYKYAKYLRRELLGVKGVKRINIIGNRDEVINIVLSKEQIARNGIVPTQIMSTLQAAGKTVDAGKYRSGDERIAIYVDSAVENEEDIRNLQIRTLDGKTMRLGDIARVERAFAEPQRNGFFVNGQPALAICMAMESSAIVPDVGAAVDVKLAEAMKNVPAGFHAEKIFFQPDKVNEAISSFMWNLVESVVIVILGLLGLVSLPVTQYPDIAPPTVRVNTSYQGANAQAVLNSVIAPLEEQINGVENMMYMTSTATNTGDASIEVYFKQGTDPDMAAVNVQNRVSKALGLLPSEVTQVGVTAEKRQTSMLLGFAFFSPDDRYDIKFLENYANINIIPEIKRIPGVGDAMVMGADYSMRIWLKPDVMAQYGLMPTDVAAALAEQNIEAAPGQFGESGDQSFQYIMRYKGRLQTEEEFGDIVVRATSDGEVLRLKDIANI